MIVKSIAWLGHVAIKSAQVMRERVSETLGAQPLMPADVGERHLSPVSTDGLPAVDPNHRRLALDTRFVVVGAGPAGLTMAECLRRLGYRDVVVLESSDRSGGKCCTVQLDGRPYDMGAVVAAESADYRRLVKFAKEKGAVTEPAPRHTSFDLTTGTEAPLGFFEELKVATQACKYLALHMLAWEGVDGTDLQGVSPELYQTWKQLAEKRGLHDFSNYIQAQTTGFGYGYHDEVPAAYYAALMRPDLSLASEGPGWFTWERGFQAMWDETSKELDVRLNCKITGIKRDDHVQIQLESGETLIADQLIVGCNPAYLDGVMDKDQGERELFHRVETYDYRTYAIEVNGMKSAGSTEIGFIQSNMVQEKKGHAIAWFKRHAESAIYVFYVLADKGIADSEVIKNIAADVGALGGELGAVRATKHWDYFPHVDGEALADGYFGDVRRAQGVRHTTYVGETVAAFSTVAHIQAHAAETARALVQCALPGMKDVEPDVSTGQQLLLKNLSQ